MGEFDDITKTGIQPVRNPDLYGDKNPSPATLALNRARAASRNALLGNIGYESLYNDNVFNMQDYEGSDLGKSRYDTGLYINPTQEDIQNRRADNQPWIEQLTNGILKGVVTAGTTFADGVVGSLIGIGNLAVQAANGNINSGTDALNAFVDNPVSKWLQQVNQQFEDWLPNYYSTEEQQSVFENPSNLFTANFVGDKFLKNLGFMIGAAYSGKVNAGAVSKALGMTEARNAFKGLNIVAKDGKKLNSLSDIVKAAKTGDAFLDGQQLSKALADNAKQMLHQEWGLKMYGAVTSAMGEARIEAVQNTEDWYKEHEMLIRQNSDRLKQNILNDIYTEANETGAPYFTLQFDRETGNYTPVLTREGQMEYARRLTDINSQESSALEQLQKDRAAVSNNIFLLNTALLSATNLFEYGRFIAGGYNTNRPLVKDLVKKGTELPYEASKKARNKAIAKAVANPLVEGSEEINQRYISTGVGLKYAADLNKFYGYKVDPDADMESSNAFNAAIQGFKETFTDPSAWEEFLIGGLSAMVGMPSFNVVHNEDGTIQYKEKTKKDGTVVKTPVRKLQMDGEFWNSIRDAKTAATKSKELTDKLNEIIQKPEFVNYWRGYNRHKLLDNIKEQSLKEGNAFAYKNADSDQLISDMLMFEEAGRIQDVYDMINEGLNVTLDDVAAIREQARNKETNADPFKDMTDEEVINHVKKQAKDLQDFLPKYLEVRKNLKTTYGEDIDPEVLEALTHQYLTIDDAETRTKSLVEEVLPKLNNIITRVSRISGEELPNLNNLKDLYNFYVDNKLQNTITEAVSKYGLTQDVAALGNIMSAISRSKEASFNRTFDENLSDEERKQAKASYENAITSLARTTKIISDIKEGKYSSFSPAEVEDLIDNTVDLLQLSVYRSKFLDSLNVLSNNPSAFNKANMETQRVMLQKAKEKKAENTYDSLVSKNNSEEGLSQKEFNSVLNNSDNINNGIVAMIRERINGSDDNSLKEKLKAYDEYERLKKVVSDLINEHSDNPEYAGIGVYTMLTDEEEPVLSSEELFEKMELFINDPNEDPAEAEELASLLDEIKDRLGIIKAGRHLLNNDEEETQEVKKEPAKTETKEETKEETTTDEETRQLALQTFLDELNDSSLYPDGTLQKIIDGTIELKYSESELSLIKETASKILNDRNRQYVREEGGMTSIDDTTKLDRALEDADKRSVADDTDNPLFKESEKNSFRGVALTKWSIPSLKKYKNLKLFEGIDEKQKAVIQALDNLKMYDFIDTGALATLNRRVQREGNPEGVHLVFISNPGSDVFSSERKDGEGKVYNILLGVEITAEDREFLKRWEDAGYTNYQTISGKTYQIVGIVKNPNKENTESKEAYNNLYKKVIVESALRQYSTDGNKEGFRIGFRPNTTTPYYTTIKDFYSGRMAQANSETEDYDSITASINERTISNIKNNPIGGHGWVLFTTDKDGILEANYSPGLDLNRVQNFGTLPITKSGCLYLVIPGANGKYYYQHVNIKRFKEFDFNENSLIGNEIKSIIKDILTYDSKNTKNTNWEKRLTAKRRLAEWLYIPKGYEFSIHPRSAGARIADKEVNTVEEAIEALKNSSVRFQIDKNLVTVDKDAIDNMALSGLITTDYLDAYHHNGNYSINYLDETGNVILPKTKKPKLTEGRDLSTGKPETLRSIQHNNKEFEIDVNTKHVYYKGRDIQGDYEEEEVIFLWEILNGEIEGVEGEGLTMYRKEMSNGLPAIAVKYGKNNIAKIVDTDEELQKIYQNIQKYKAEHLSDSSIEKGRHIIMGEEVPQTPQNEEQLSLFPEEPVEETPKEQPAQEIKEQAGTPVNKPTVAPKGRSFDDIARMAKAKRQKQKAAEIKEITYTQEQMDRFNIVKFGQKTNAIMDYVKSKGINIVSEEANELDPATLANKVGFDNINQMLDDLEHFVNCG